MESVLSWMISLSVFSLIWSINPWLSLSGHTIPSGSSGFGWSVSSTLQRKVRVPWHGCAPGCPPSQHSCMSWQRLFWTSVPRSHGASRRLSEAYGRHFPGKSLLREVIKERFPGVAVRGTSQSGEAGSQVPADHACPRRALSAANFSLSL